MQLLLFLIIIVYKLEYSVSVRTSPSRHNNIFCRYYRVPIYRVIYWYMTRESGLPGGYLVGCVRIWKKMKLEWFSCNRLGWRKKNSIYKTTTSNMPPAFAAEGTLGADYDDSPRLPNRFAVCCTQMVDSNVCIIW